MNTTKPTNVQYNDNLFQLMSKMNELIAFAEEAGLLAEGSIPKNLIGEANGVAGLDANAKVKTANLTDASISAKGAVQLSSATDSTSEALASTPKAVKDAYDLATTAKSTADTAKTTADTNTTNLATLKTQADATKIKADNAIPVSQKGVANGVATLDANGNLEQIPDIPSVAEDITIADTANVFTAGNVEGALNELATAINSMKGNLITTTNSILGS